MEGMIVNMNKEKRLRVIQQLIATKEFNKAIQKIDELIPVTTCIRKCVNLKAQCFLELQKYDEACEIYKDYYPYVMIDEEDIVALKHLAEIHYHLGNTIRAKKYENSYKCFTKTESEYKTYLCQQYAESEQLYGSFINNSDNIKEILESIIIDNFQMLRMTEAAVYYALMKRLKIDIKFEIEEEFAQLIQVKEFINELSVRDNNKYCVISAYAEQASILRDRCLAKVLSMLGALVYHIIPFYISDNASFSVEKCFTSQIKEGNIIKIYTPNVGGRAEPRIVSEVITALNQKNNTDIPIVLFGDSNFLMDINEDVETSKLIEMYFNHYENQPIPGKDCVLLGPYLKSISYIWGINIIEIFAKEATVDFSIIIPVRNSIKYLRETIETCLEQDYEGTYEVLISDNSKDDNINVQGIVNSIDNSKIRYIKTPFDLTLTKSFEFAYFNAHGRYLVSLGADDGLIKTALSKMANVMKLYPDNNVFAWNRAGYTWPDFSYGGNQNHVIFNPFLSSDTKLKEIETKPFIRKFALGDISCIYIPSMYLRTCVKREHINKIIKVTGKFEDGDSQDVYTGMLNLFLEDKIIYADYPLVISGKTTSSVGFTSNQSIQTMEALGERFRRAFRAHRYTNYHSQDYRDLYTIFLPFGTIMLPYREFIKVNHYNIRVHDYRDKRDIIKILYSVYEVLPDKHCDEALVLKQLERIAKVAGNDIYNEYLHKRGKWERLLKIKHQLKRSIKNKTLLSFLKKIYNVMFNIRSGWHSKHSSNGTNKISKPILDIDCSKYDVYGIKGAVECLLTELTKIHYQI